VNSITSGIAVLGAELFQSLGVPLSGSHKTAAFAAAFEQSPNGGLVVDGASLKIIGANETMRRQLESSEADLQNLTLHSIFEYDCQEEILQARLRGPDPKSSLRARHRRKDGREFELELVGYQATTARGSVLVYMVQDVSLKNRLESRLLKKQEHLDQLAHLAHHDALTGLPNRLFLAAQMPQALVSADRKGRLLAMLLVDIDRFKHVNDAHGNDVGDQLLIAVAKRIKAAARDHDLVTRVGGDEFIVVLSDLVSEEQGREAAVRMIETLSAPFEIDGHPVTTSASIGVSLFPRDGADMEELLQHCDEAMNQAKERGRNTWQVYGPAMDRKLKRRINVEAHLREAMRALQLDVYYQPIVDIQTQKVVALESLLRWHHPSYGLIPTERFIGIAEQTGLIIPIGEFVLNRVLQDIRQWRADGCKLVPVSINVSAIQMQRGNLAESIADRLGALGLDPAMLQIELTEDTAFERRAARGGEPDADALVQLRELGVHVAIDDFGTGHSSLSHLRHRRVDSLKIDRSFVRDLANDSGDLAIVAAVTAMARHLRIPVVAVGVESWQQLETLRGLGCSFAQGHLFSRPIPADRCPVYLSAEPVDFARRSEEYESAEATGVNPALLFLSTEETYFVYHEQPVHKV
jgi:diguanylate cyclase (GGDEF)-like protein/PAS domain S-box-containing protein